MRFREFLKQGILTSAVAVAVFHSAHTSPAFAAEPTRASVYAPYESLIGTWDVTAAGSSDPVAIERFTWGPGNSYIWFTTSILVGGREEPHFEGMLVWNGVNRNLDMLLAIDLAGGRAQEQGNLTVEPDGSISRNIVGIYSEGTMIPTGERVGPEGARVNFRQMFRPLSPTRMATSLTREGDSGWQESFLGSGNLVMTRRAESPPRPGGHG